MSWRSTASTVLLAAIWNTPLVAQELPGTLFQSIQVSNAGNSPPPPDSIRVYESSINIQGIAQRPTSIDIVIPRPPGNLAVVVQLESMDRREGFAERDADECQSGNIASCEIVPIPGLPDDQFSYTWTGQGNGYDLRLTVHQGKVVGVLSGPVGRFAISARAVKELSIDFFHLAEQHQGSLNTSHEFPKIAEDSPRAMSEAEVAQATIARIAPRTAPSKQLLAATQVDMLVLFTEEARRQAGGSAAQCSDTAGVLAYVHQGINDVNTAFSRSGINARLGVVTVAKLAGYTLIPDDGTYLPSLDNRNALRTSTGIKALRNAVGADVVQVLFDTQTNLGPCGVAYVQRRVCSTQGDPTLPTPCLGAAFKEYAYYLNTVQCSSSMDVFTHELGHVLGADHDAAWAPPSTDTSYPYSFGYYISGQFQTVMSQQFGTSAPQRLLQFSNPSINYAGTPTGSVANANNALAIGNLIAGTSAFRSRPNVIFSNGFENSGACPAINY